MILINKTLSQQKLNVTISEKEPTTGSTLKLKVENKQSNLNYELILPSNTSQYKSRYDEFIFPTSSITTWKEGTYLYTIVESISSTENILEIGLMKVIDVQVDEFISIEEDDEADDYIVLQ